MGRPHLFPFYRGGNWGPVRSNDLPRFTQLLPEEPEPRLRHLTPESAFLATCSIASHLLSVIPFSPSRWRPQWKPLRPKPTQLPPEWLQPKGQHQLLEKGFLQLLKPKWGPQPRQVGPAPKEVPGWDVEEAKQWPQPGQGFCTSRSDRSKEFSHLFQ